MEIITKYMTRNDCYRAGRKITVKGIMVHSTATPGVMAADWFDRWNKSYALGEIDRQVCVHAFVDDKVVMQYLPWDHRGWHAGGRANDTHVSFEICEPGGFRYSSGSTMVGYDVKANEEYFKKAYANAVDLCVYLCKMFGLTEKDIIDHSEGSKLGIASAHGDVMHWFPKHGKSMDTLRADVKKALESSSPQPQPQVQDKEIMELQQILNRLKITDSNGKALVVDGIHGPLTASAIKKLQAIMDLQQVGIAGLASWAAIREILAKPMISSGSTGYAVRYVQWRVNTGVDGIFGPLTLKAVKTWQAANKLTADGIVGPNTWAKLIG